MNSFFPDDIASWNIFMEIFKYKEVPTVGVLKKDILFLIRPVSKSFFKIFDHVGLHYLFQLRVSVSPLREVTNGVSTSLILHLASVIVATASKMQVMFYFHAPLMSPKEQPL